jgi:stage V sporulation protein B
VKKIYLAPAVASIFMGIVAWGVFKLLYMLTRINSISVVIAILVAVVFYAIAIIVAGGYSEKELMALPKGALIVKFAKKLHLI